MKPLSVPVRFRRCKIKHVTKFSTGWTPSTTDDEAYQGVNTWVTIGDLKSKLVYSSSKSISDLAVREKGIPLSPKGSLLFSFKLSVGNVSFAAKDLYTNEAIATFRKSPTLSLDYAFYAFPLYIPLNASENIYGAKLLNQDLIANAEIFIPEHYEQRQIAAYLNRETAKIDKLIAKQQKLIKLLQEKRQAVISQAVTKGLDPNVKMKDSRVEWLGEVPEHWKISKVGFEFCFLNKKRIPLSSEERGKRQGRYPYYGASGVIDYVDDYLFDEDLILLGEDGANLLNRSTPLAFIATGKYWVNNHAHILKPQDGNLKYWCEVLEARDYTTECSGSAQPKLTAEALNAIKIPLPPLDERSQIAEFIELQTEVLAKLIEKSKNSIKLMNEHRQALITAAVTGKIDVRSLVTEDEVAALDADPVLETAEEDFESEVLEDTYITEEE